MEIYQIIKEILAPKGFIESIKRVFRKKEFGTLSEVRLLGRFNCPGMRIKVPITKKVTLDTFLILPILKENEQEESFLMRSQLIEDYINETGVINEPLEKLSPSKLKRSVELNQSECEGKTFALFCLPNAGLYELGLCYESEAIQVYRKAGVYLLYWNYRGYGYSTGSVSMEKMIEDGENLKKLLKFGFKASKLIVHGRSIGGHVAKALSSDSEMVILDRSFSSISTIPRDMFGKRWVQFAFDLMVDNYQGNIERLLESSCSKVVISDPNVDL